MNKNIEEDGWINRGSVAEDVRAEADFMGCEIWPPVE